MIETDVAERKIAKSQGKWWEKQGLKSPVVTLEEFEAGKGRVPDIKKEFGYFPTSVLVLSRLPELFKFLADQARPMRNQGNIYHAPFKASHFPPAASWFLVKYWSRPGDLILDPFGNRANIGLIANWLGRGVVVNDIVPSYCSAMEAAGKRRARPDLPWTVLNQDAAELPGVVDDSIDLVVTGPPFYNLEKYEDVPGQASSFKSYDQFRAWYRRVADRLLSVVKPGRFAALKVSNWRKGGRLVTFTWDTLRTFTEAGWDIHDELICVEQAPMAVAFSWDVKVRERYVHKAHQTVLIFKRPE